MDNFNRLIHEKCVGCSRIGTHTTDGELTTICNVYPNPSYWWEKRNGCPLATHTKKTIEKDERIRVGQQKQKIKKKG